MKNARGVLRVVLFVLFALGSAGCGNKKLPENVGKAINSYIGFWNTGQFDNIENVMDKGFQLIESPGFEPKTGIELFKKLVLNTRLSYPDFKLQINETVFEKDRIAFLWTVTGTNSGHGEVSAAGRTINGKGISIIHFKDGIILDEWRSNNNLAWLIQEGYTIVSPGTAK